MSKITGSEEDLTIKHQRSLFMNNHFCRTSLLIFSIDKREF